MSRSSRFAVCLALLLSPCFQGCGASGAAATGLQVPLPPLRTAKLEQLVPLAGLKWMLVADPQALLSVPWVVELLNTAVGGARFSQFARATGVDLRAVPMAIVTSTAGRNASPNLAPPVETSATPNADDATFYLLRHASEASVIERAFRSRLTSDEKRSTDRPDLIRVSGRVGASTKTAIFLGPDVVGFQDGGSVSRGPARVAALFSEGKLQKVSPALATEPLRSLALRLGKAEVMAFAPGPFDGELAHGLRGLLGAATGVGATLRPIGHGSFGVQVAVSGDFSQSATLAANELRAAWNELAASALGHLLGLDTPVIAMKVTPENDMLILSIELSGKLLSEGLAKATASRVEDIFK